MIEADLDLIIAKAGLGLKGSYRPDEVALILGVHRTTVYALMARGDLGYISVVDTRRITYAAIVEYLNKYSVVTCSQV